VPSLPVTATGTACRATYLRSGRSTKETGGAGSGTRVAVTSLG
jgi:hypothetical protein